MPESLHETLNYDYDKDYALEKKHQNQLPIIFLQTFIANTQTITNIKKNKQNKFQYCKWCKHL